MSDRENDVVQNFADRYADFHFETYEEIRTKIGKLEDELRQEMASTGDEELVVRRAELKMAGCSDLEKMTCEELMVYEKVHPLRAE